MRELLRVEHVSIQFGGLKAVNDVSFAVQQGQTFGIIGPNGAGKTTLFNLCSGVYKPTSGKVFLEDEDITGCSSDVICKKGICRTFQSSQLFSFMSVLDNVKVGCHIVTKTNMLDSIFHTKTYKADEEFAISQSLMILEKVGLSKYRDVMAGNLPYGIQRKVEIARALATNPKIILLDEPAAGMNPNETADLRDFVKQRHDEGQTVLLIEHDMKFVMNCCEQILVLNFGERICEGTPKQVREDKVVQEAYFGSGMVSKGED